MTMGLLFWELKEIRHVRLMDMQTDFYNATPDSNSVAFDRVISVKRTPYCQHETLSGSQNNNGEQGGSVAEYNANNTWYFNGNNRVLNNNNRYNDNFRARPVLDFGTVDKRFLDQYLVPLEELVEISRDHKNTKNGYTDFSVHYYSNIVYVWHKINNKPLELAPLRGFIVTHPKLREVVYCEYTDKLIQTFYASKMSDYLENGWFVDHSYSCRKGKGVIAAVNRVSELIREESNNYTRDDTWLATIDLERFFLSIDTKVVINRMQDFIREHCKDDKYYEILMYLTEVLYGTDYASLVQGEIREKILASVPPRKTIINNEPGIGIPLGNWPSQIAGNFLTTFALLYLESMGYKYVHYTDDTFIVIHNKNKWRQDLRRLIAFYRDELHLKINPNKYYLQHYSKGIEFLGRKLRYNRILPSNRTYDRVQFVVDKNIELSKEDPDFVHKTRDQFMQRINSYLGLLIHMDTYNFRKHIIEQLMASNWSKVFKFDTVNYSKVTINEIKNNHNKKRTKQWRKFMGRLTSSVNSKSIQCQSSEDNRSFSIQLETKWSIMALSGYIMRKDLTLVNMMMLE